jgi:hypothetical protein
VTTRRSLSTVHSTAFPCTRRASPLLISIPIRCSPAPDPGVDITSFYRHAWALKGFRAPVAHALLEVAVERRESLLSDLPLVRAPDLDLRPGTEPLGRQFLRLHRRPREMQARSMRRVRPSRQTPRTMACACGCSVSWWLTAAHSMDRPRSRSTRSISSRT